MSFIHTLRSLVLNLWHDDRGVVSTEYLALGSIVVLGGVSGLASMTDAVNSEMREYGNAVRQMRQTYSVPGMRAGGASTAGSSAMDQGGGCSGAGCEAMSP